MESPKLLHLSVTGANYCQYLKVLAAEPPVPLEIEMSLFIVGSRVILLCLYTIRYHIVSHA